jgi:biopolymer transport protein ExbB
MITQDELLHWLQLGGVTLSSILFCSVLAVAVAIERSLAHRSFAKHMRRLAAAVRGALAGKEGLEGAKKVISSGYPMPVARIFLSGVDAALKGAEPQKVEAAVDRERQRAGLSLRRWMWVLGTIGATAPFIGLFGTVWGIMRAMSEIGATGQTGFTVVAAGISEALITTAVGIAVAIEAVILFNAIQNRLQTLVLELKLEAEEFVEELRASPAGKPAEAKA